VSKAPSLASLVPSFVQTSASYEIDILPSATTSSTPALLLEDTGSSAVQISTLYQNETSMYLIPGSSKTSSTTSSFFLSTAPTASNLILNSALNNPDTAQAFPTTPTTSKTKTYSRAATPTATIYPVVENATLLSFVYGLTIDEYDNLYVTIPPPSPHTAPGYPLIYMINSVGTPSLTLIANLSNDGQGNFFDNQGICYFNRSLYVPRMGQLTKIDLADNNKVSRFAGRGDKTLPLTDGPKLSATFKDAAHCTVDQNGNIYVGENSGLIRKIANTGNVSTVANFQTVGIYGMILNGSSNLIFSNVVPYLVQSLNLTNGNITTIVGNSSNAGAYSGFGEVGPALSVAVRSNGLAFDELGNLYFPQRPANLVSKLNTTNYVSSFATGLSYPRQIVFDSKGRLFVTDQGNCSIKMISW
jgi:hypothetical protein